ncbi:Uma2 family endonuclease [Floridanema evergladense]|uniref:Uma2 family endonuclease n=1 Tax=Floridaenema evergladense BLCC-F167 TaxID=3153639 RepID=A0ABV4WTM3_9CYAN
MIITPVPLTFKQFLDFNDGNELNEYELVAGRLVLMPEPSELHEEILEFLSFMFEVAYRRRKLKYSVRKRNALQINETQSRRPDIAIIERPQFFADAQPRMGIQTRPFMIVEIASFNWSTDLIDKQEEYLVLGVPEYWIIDYRGQIPAKYCQRGKGKKAIVLTLENGEYQRSEYLEGEIIPCQTFPDLKLTLDQILAADAEDVV